MKKKKKRKWKGATCHPSATLPTGTDATFYPLAALPTGTDATFHPPAAPPTGTDAIRPHRLCLHRHITCYAAYRHRRYPAYWHRPEAETTFLLSSPHMHMYRVGAPVVLN